MGGENRSRLIEAITTPLGFFVLSLLIVEAFLGSAFFSSGIDAKDKITCIWLGVSLFVFVILVVAILVWNKPDHLTFDNRSHLIDRGKMRIFGTSDDPISAKAVSEEKKSTPVEEGKA